MKLKEQHDALKDSDGEDDDDDDCDKCNEYEGENEVMREQVEKQTEIIEKLSRAQELLMMQYKIMELGLNKELASIHQTQMEIAKMQGNIGDDDEEEEGDNNDNEEPEEGDKPDDDQQ